MEQAWSVEARTGCSCCHYENHTRGLYVSFEAAQRRVAKFKTMPLVASQYSRTGHYDIQEHKIETLPDGRMIVDGHLVLDADAKVFDSAEDGTLLLKGDTLAEGDLDRLGDSSWPY